MPAHDPYRGASRAALDPPTSLANRQPHLLAVVHRYLPAHNAGAEHTLHAILRDLVEHGWDCLVAAAEHRGRTYEWDGVTVTQAPLDRGMRHLWEWADVGVTHLRATRGAVAWARRGRPLVHLVHNHSQLATERVAARDASLVVWNSEWVAREWERRTPWPSLVVRPPVRVADYATENPDRFLCGSATLLNLTEVKGGKMFWRLAAARPDLPFLGVEGAYYLQEAPPDLPNVEVVENAVDVLPIYQRTRVLLMPSHYESWGRTAVEAMASGIPVVASDTPGLRECLTSPEHGECGLLVDAHDEAAWLDALATLDDPGGYATWSERAVLRAAEIDEQTEHELGELRGALLALAEGRSLAASMAR